jgi:hypothetical protein
MESDADAPREERKNLLLRMLINEMLEQVRELNRHAGPWDAEERARAEETLERVMGQVRSEAIRRAAD